MTDKQEVLNLIAQTIFNKKGFNILVLDVRNFSSLTDYYVIAEGTVDRHVRSIGTAIIDAVHPNYKPFHTEGTQAGDWVVIDFVDIIIHLFTPELREKYALEQLWHEAEIVDVKIDLTSKGLDL
jgi:ribosome-associated protein